MVVHWDFVFLVFTHPLRFPLIRKSERILTDRDAEIPAWIPEKYFLTVNFEAL